MGTNHGVTCAVSEFGLTNNNANVTANSYSSILGTFADNGVEYFTPWYWYPGMWETLHLYSRYAKTTRVQSVSSNELDVSAYSSSNTSGDSLTVILVNRALTATHNTTVNLANFTVQSGTYSTKQISGLPSTETFVSHISNALHSGTVTATVNTFSVSLPALSTTAIILKGTTFVGVSEIAANKLDAILYPNPIGSGQNVFVDISTQNISDCEVEVLNVLGKVVFAKVYSGKEPILEIPCGNISQGVYLVKLSTSSGNTWSSRFVKM